MDLQLVHSDHSRANRILEQKPETQSERIGHVRNVSRT